MPGLASLTTSAPAVRRPAVEIRFGDAETWSRTLVCLTVDIGIGPGVDVVEWVAAADGPAAAAGDRGGLALGYDDSTLEQVFSGEIDSVGCSVHGTVRVTAVNGGSALARLRLDRSYRQQTTGEVISDLAGEAGVATGTIESGVDLPFVVVDDRRTAWDHVATLARRSGCWCTFTPAGELEVVAVADGPVVQTFTYGEDILTLERVQAPPVVGGVHTIGEGAAGSQGEEAWCWLIKDPAAVSAETGAEPRRSLCDPALRSADAANTAAEGHLRWATLLATTGRLLVPGAPAVVPGTTIEITGAGDAFDGQFLVRHVRHHVTKAAGFTTSISFVQASDRTAGGLP